MLVFSSKREQGNGKAGERWMDLKGELIPSWVSSQNLIGFIWCLFPSLEAGEYFQVKWLSTASKFSLSFLSCQIILPLYKGTTLTLCYSAWDQMEVPSTNICPWFSRAETVHKSKVTANHVLSSLVSTGTFYQILRKQKFPSSETFLLVFLLFWTQNPPFHINDISGFQELFWNRLPLMRKYYIWSLY